MVPDNEWPMAETESINEAVCESFWNNCIDRRFRRLNAEGRSAKSCASDPVAEVCESRH